MSAYDTIKAQIAYKTGVFPITCPKCQKGANAKVTKPMRSATPPFGSYRSVKTTCRHCGTSYTFIWRAGSGVTQAPAYPAYELGKVATLKPDYWFETFTITAVRAIPSCGVMTYVYDGTLPNGRKAYSIWHDDVVSVKE